MEVSYCEILICKVVYRWKINCDKLMMHITKPKANTKLTQQRVIANKPTRKKVDNRIIKNI